MVKGFWSGFCTGSNKDATQAAAIRTTSLVGFVP